MILRPWHQRQLQSDRPLVRDRRRYRGGDGSHALGLFPPAERVRRSLALFRPHASLARLVALSAGGPAAVGRLQRKKEASRLGGCPGRFQHEHAHGGRGPGAVALGGRKPGRQAGAGTSARRSVPTSTSSSIASTPSWPSPRQGEPVEEAKPSGRETSLGSAITEAQKAARGNVPSAGAARDSLGFRQQWRAPIPSRPPAD